MGEADQHHRADTGCNHPSVRPPFAVFAQPTGSVRARSLPDLPMGRDDVLVGVTSARDSASPRLVQSPSDAYEMAGTRVYVYGFPSLYGGGGNELHHHISIWQSLGAEVHLIPSDPGYRDESLLPEMLANGVVVHELDDFSCIERNAPVFGFCNSAFLENIDGIREHSTNTVFVNCMTWLFDLEIKRMAEGKIRTFLYQNEDVRVAHSFLLGALNQSAEVNFLTFVPYFDISRFPFVAHRSDEYFGCGR